MSSSWCRHRRCDERWRRQPDWMTTPSMTRSDDEQRWRASGNGRRRRAANRRAAASVDCDASIARLDKTVERREPPAARAGRNVAVRTSGRTRRLGVAIKRRFVRPRCCRRHLHSSPTRRFRDARARRLPPPPSPLSQRLDSRRRLTNARLARLRARAVATLVLCAAHFGAAARSFSRPPRGRQRGRRLAAAVS